MATERGLKIIKEAIANQNPAKIREVFVPDMTWDNMLILRKSISNITIEPRSYKTVFAWLLHDDPEIVRATGILALWISDLGFQTELFNYLAQIGTLKIPLTVNYDSAEKEFSIEIPGVPGWCLSHYGRDNPDINLVLKALEKLYVRIYPEREVPPYFRR
ncbi:hypothetical protein ACFLWL_02065 [Chloroflexota bacterium]